MDRTDKTQTSRVIELKGAAFVDLLEQARHEVSRVQTEGWDVTGIDMFRSFDEPHENHAFIALEKESVNE